MSLLPSKFYFDDFFDHYTPSKKEYMKCDIYEEENNYVIEMDIPGFQKNDIQIEVENGYLTIFVENPVENSENKNYLRRERIYENYERSFYIGEVNSEEISAEFRDGILKVIFPKKQEEVSKKRIDIQ